MTDPSSNKHPWSTPIRAPLSPPFPFAFRNMEVLTLVWKTDAARAERLLPPGLTLRSECVLAHIYNMNDTDYLGSYHECNIMLDAELPGVAAGGYSPFLFLDSDGGISQGREVHGQPKKMGHPRVELRGDLIVGMLERNEIDVLTGTFAYKQERGTLDQLKEETFDFSVNLNYKVLQNIDGSPLCRQITSRTLTDFKIHECWRGPCSVDIRPNMQAPLHLLPVMETGIGYYWRADFTLVEGTILHDFLKLENSKK